MEQLLYLLLVGLVAGWLAGLVMKRGGFGLVGDMVIGVLGAFLGGYLFKALHISMGSGLLGQIAVASIGAVVLILVLRLIKRV